MQYVKCGLAILASALTLRAAAVTFYDDLAQPVEDFNTISGGPGEGPLYASFSTGSSAATLTSVVLELETKNGVLPTGVSHTSGAPRTGRHAHATASVNPRTQATGPITVGLYADNGGNPGTLISTIGTIADSSLTGASAQYTVTPPAPIPLAANTRYWIGLSSADTVGAWDTQQGDAGTGVSTEFNFTDGSTFPNTDGSAYIMQVNATTSGTPPPPPATPAPASLMLMITALGLGGLYLLRRRIPNPL